MNKTALYISILLSVIAFGCAYKPDACIEGSDRYYKNIEAKFRTCGEGEVFFWEFGNDSAGARGDNVQHIFERTGTYEVKLTGYSDDGRKTDEASKLVEVGYKRVDSIVVTQLILNGVEEKDNDQTRPDVYCTFGSYVSKDTIFNAPKNASQSDPFVFRFDTAVYNDLSIGDEVQLFDYNSSPGINDLLIEDIDSEALSDMENPQVWEIPLSLRLEIYWTLVE
ncbi:MAG: PKD domain-containing protein [Salibacter sp.]|uniref:PKD domain-containing protein n=1 Tax=Salibacter sp. TaxID=2010995 RepID=UPI00287092A9|nr:PKD domain-containing protein [Salibacter sp.]MDR9398419.1 PKD domain-containing protein [Salibacter sp.]